MCRRGEIDDDEIVDASLTGKGVVATIITELCVFQVDRTGGGLLLTEIADGATVDEVRERTDAKFKVADELKSMEE